MVRASCSRRKRRNLLRQRFTGELGRAPSQLEAKKEAVNEDFAVIILSGWFIRLYGMLDQPPYQSLRRWLTMNLTKTHGDFLRQESYDSNLADLNLASDRRTS